MSRIVVSHFAMQLFSFTSICVTRVAKKAISNIFCVTRGLLWSSVQSCTEIYRDGPVCTEGTKLWHCGTVQLCTALHRTWWFTDVMSGGSVAAAPAYCRF
jgi:hypothetical protein